MMQKLRVPLTQGAIGIVLILAWQGACALHLADPSVLPAPATVAVTIGQLLGSPAFLSDAGVTLLRVAVAFLIGAPIALTVGFVMGENVAVGKSLGPLFNLVLAVPQSIFLPIFVLLLGLGFTEKVMFGITHVFFVVVVNTMAAVREVPRDYVTAARSFGAGRLRIYRSIYLPAMAPQVVTGLRFGLIFDIIGILLAEMYAAESGLGLQLARWGDSMNVGKLMAATILISVATILVNEGMRGWESRVSRWQRSAEAS
jgi:NitT/TauT family transport system permease protein